MRRRRRSGRDSRKATKRDRILARIRRLEAQAKIIGKRLERAMNRADSRGYTGFQSGRGGLFDDPEVKRLNNKHHATLYEIARLHRRARRA